MRVFEEFTAAAKPDFKSLMVNYWMESEGYSTESEALSAYGGEVFDILCARATASRCTYVPDLGYSDKEADGTLCFEKEDNNMVIPVRFLIDIKFQGGIL